MWLSSAEFGAHHLSVKKQRLDGTGQWLLAKAEFQEWQKSSESSMLWLHGIRKDNSVRLVNQNKSPLTESFSH
jgi:hypothetical protein